MSAQTCYPNASAFRRALEQRLRTEAQIMGIPLDRLRKEAAFNRLLIRLTRSLPDFWALKGGLAIIARLGNHIRGTKDADANWRASRDELESALFEVENLDLDDWFTFTFGDGRSLQGEGKFGALRYPVSAILDGRVFERFSLDINLVDPQDPRPVELVKVQRNPFEFVNEPSLEIPMVTPAQQLAEKLHAYVRFYEDGRSNRAKDLFDILVIADQVHLPALASLTDAMRQTFQIRDTAWPPVLIPPPDSWNNPWTGFMVDYALPWPNLSDAFAALENFLTPILDTPVRAPRKTWNQSKWQWL